MGLSPTRTEDVAAMLGHASAEGRKIVPIGGGTRSRRGRPDGAAAPLSTRGLDRIIEHHPAELTATLEAGVLAADFAERLAAAGQWWPQADIRPGSTVGGVLAAAASSRGRLRHGPVRDSLLQVVLVTGDGRVVTGGGRTVKGVAGYDIPRLAVGSMGTLGVITQVTLKLWPLPPARGWFARDGELDDLLAAAERVRRERWRPAAILLTPGRLSVELVGALADVTAPEGLVAAEQPADPEGTALVDAGVPPARVPDLVRLAADRGWPYLAEWGTGVIRLALPDRDAIASARAAAVATGGHAVVVDAPDALRDDPSGMDPPGGAIIERIMQSFDPAGVFAAGHLPGDAR